MPSWLQNDAAEEGLARSAEGMSLYIKVSGSRTMFRLDAWKIGTLLGYRLVLGRRQVVRGADLLRSPPQAAAQGLTLKPERRSIRSSPRLVIRV